MTVTLATSHLSPLHSMAYIDILLDFSLLYLIIECRPSASTIVFGLRSEERLRADDTVVDARSIGLVILV